MTNIVIKKRVSLDFLGDEYKEAYITLKAVPVSQYEDLIPELDKLVNKRLAMIKLIIEVLKERFIEGKFPVDGGLVDISKEDIDAFDEATIAELFGYITGQALPPKQ